MITIHEATEEDLPAVLQLYQRAGLDGPEEKLSHEEASEILRAMKRYPSHRCYLAIEAGVIVGTFTLLIMDNLVHQGARSGILEGVAVDPAHQGHGIGRIMMQHAMAEARRHNCYKLSLSSNVKREDAYKFYETLGFELYGYGLSTKLDD